MLQFFFLSVCIRVWRLLCYYFFYITKTCLYNFDPLKPHFYMYKVKLGFTGVYIIFLISAQKHRLWVLVRTASSIYVLCRYIKKYQNFLSKLFSFLFVKFTMYLNRRDFVMTCHLLSCCYISWAFFTCIYYQCLYLC